LQNGGLQEPQKELVVADAECDKDECCEQKTECCEQKAECTGECQKADCEKKATCDKAECNKENCDKTECTGECQKPEGKECCGKENCEKCEKKQGVVPPTQEGEVPPTPATEEAAPAVEATDVVAEADGAPVEAAAEEPEAEEGSTVEAIAGTVTATYWLLMLVGRLLGAALGARFSARKMLSFASILGICLVGGAIFLDPAITVNLPVFKGTEGFGMALVPINAALLVLCGLCTSVMWGGIFNLAVEGLGKYTEKASGIFMALVCGGGILPFVQNWIVDFTGDYLVSYWLVAAGLAYMLFYALIGSKNVNKDIPTE
jgi:hypothetical protein